MQANKLKILLIILFIVAVLAVLAVLIGVTQIEKQQARSNQEILNQRVSDKSKDKTEDKTKEKSSLVLVFSRSGNTAVLGQKIAERNNADFIRLEAEDYELGLIGLSRALMDARGNIATISPEKVDLSTYETVYLGSPIWLYSPSPPIWQFAQNNSFEGKRVVLFNSFNSKFEQHFIDDFERLVKEKGAVEFEHRYIKRGRMLDQISTELLLKRYELAYEQSEKAS